ncbi:MAG: toxin C-terminal domain-containing protein [Alphaproteobacteria bacterium]|nr:toxin C-terminal domain-containing protein [Alphaproteobacteria bacterium]
MTTTFLHDGDEEIADYDNAAALLRRYVPGPGTDMPIAMVTVAGARSYFHTNRQGSTIAMSADNGTIAEGPYTYDAYGNGAPTTGVPFKYTGRRLDPETGFYFYRARYYSPALGRFLQPDPVGYDDQMNVYAYVGDDPLNVLDPTGQNRRRGRQGPLRTPAEELRIELYNAAVTRIKRVDPNYRELRDPNWVPGERDIRERTEQAARYETNATIYRTEQEARTQAEMMGFRDTGIIMHGARVYQRGNRFISRDRDGHRPGAWKAATGRPDNLRNRDTRDGTYTRDLEIRTGD